MSWRRIMWLVGTGIALAVATPPALASSDNSTKPHTWTVVMLRGKVHHSSCNPEDESSFPVFRRGRGDRIQFVSRDDRYWIRCVSPSPLRLKGEVVQRFEVYSFGSRPTPVYTFTTDAPPDSVAWERFAFEIHGAQDMPKDAADQPRELRNDERPASPSIKEIQKKKLEVDLVIDGVK